ncbi:hypothetical protein FRB99_004414 [Tulasnella sp. 403]|nr:hypothetical protein FRB99_004414 [Tulasnella sp. 403]
MAGTTESLLKELDRIEFLSSLYPTNGQGKAKSPPMGTSIDGLLEYLHRARDAVDRGEDVGDVFEELSKRLETQKKAVDDRQKELHGALIKFGKGVDKKFTNPLPSFPPLFNTPAELTALERVIGTHLLRTGEFDSAQIFFNESSIETPEATRDAFIEMHAILGRLREGDIQPALAWAITNRDFLRTRHSTLEFDLHRSHFMRLVQSSLTPFHTTAIQYSRQHFHTLYTHHPQIVPQVNRLLAALAFSPRLASSPYADLAAPKIHTDLEPAFTREYCARMGMSRQLPLRVVGDIGGNGALARIEKSKKVMKDKRGEWEFGDELLVEIPLLPQNRYHSIFACPVSKEQSTDKNPPMMLTCGHVIAKESMTRLTKGGGKIKCPYCPVESSGQPLQVHF